MSVKYRYADKAMMSWIYRETAYDTLMTGYSTTEYTQLRNFTLAIGYDDTRVPGLLGDGTEFGLESYVSRHDIRMTLTLNMATFTDVAALSAYALGTTGESDNTLDYLHDHTLTSDSQLPSFTTLATEAGDQIQYTGCVVDTLTISTSNDGYIQVVAEIIASGRREYNSQGYITALDDPPMISNMTSIFMETGASIDIKALSVDGTTSLQISTATLDLTARVLGGWTVVINNNHRAEQGYQKPNSDDNLARGECLRGARREMTATLSGVTFEDDEFEDYFLGGTAPLTAIQPHMALEISNFSEDYGVISNAWYYTMSIIFPRMTFDPIGTSGDDDGIITRDLKLTALTPVSGTDGTDDPIQFYVRDGIAEYAGAAG